MSDSGDPASSISGERDSERDSRRDSWITGLPADRVLAELEQFRADDIDWRSGRAFSLAYSAGPEVLALSEAAYAAFAGENALNVAAFPSLRSMQADVVSRVSSWLSAPAGSGGFMTSGGTESLILAVWAALNRHRRLGRPQEGLNVVLPSSAHAALEKGCAYFGIESRRVPVKSDWRADPGAMEAALDDGTVLVVGSAPQYPQGVVDPIPALARIAATRDVNMHVDACMGGVVLPALERAGHEVPRWDFRCEGVTSVSVDLHKYGYTAKGAGVLVHRDKQRRNDQTYVTDNWLGGTYGSSGILGTKSGGPIASAWAVMRHLGDEGYERLSVRARETADRIARHVADHDLLDLVAMPDTTLLCIGERAGAATPRSGAPGTVVSTLAAGLRAAGWFVDVQTTPPAVHLTVNAVHHDVVEDFLRDMDRALAESGPGDGSAAGYATIE